MNGRPVEEKNYKAFIVKKNLFQIEILICFLHYEKYYDRCFNLPFGGRNRLDSIETIALQLILAMQA